MTSKAENTTETQSPFGIGTLNCVVVILFFSFNTLLNITEYALSPAFQNSQVHVALWLKTLAMQDLLVAGFGSILP